MSALQADVLISAAAGVFMLCVAFGFYRFPEGGPIDLSGRGARVVMGVGGVCSLVAAVGRFVVLS